jgi:hypothetical protein
MPRSILILTIALTVPAMCTSCGSESEPNREHVVYASAAWDSQPEPLAQVETEPFDFQSHGPVEFLAFLESEFERLSEDDSLSDSGFFFTVRGTHRGWIQASDLPQLAERLDSEAPCLSVVRETSSFIPFEGSTIGIEAAALIEGYQAEAELTGYGGWPSRTVSDPHADREALRALAREHAR